MKNHEYKTCLPRGLNNRIILKMIVMHVSHEILHGLMDLMLFNGFGLAPCRTPLIGFMLSLNIANYSEFHVFG